MVEQWNSHGGTVWWNSVVESGTLGWNSKTVMVEQSAAKVEHRWWNSVLKQWNSIGGTVWKHSGTVRWNSVVEQWNSHGGTLWLNSQMLMVEQCGTVKHCGETVQH